MQRAAPGSSDGDTNLRNDFHHLPQPPSSSFTSSVTASAPAKRITFFRSGDTQFKGVRMAIHKRSFKCFDALLDDLSQKVPLPFGVRTITTPRGTHSIKHLEQLEDGGCYLCSDRRYVKPINMEAAGKRPAVWHHHIHPNNTRRKPSRPEESPSAQHYHRHPKRIVLVKNNDPAVRRSIILSRRTARSLRVFMDEISELMQCHVKKLYTLEGRKIDSIQSLMQCPGVLVCVGREPFRPLLMESLKKLSDERLPGMGARSRSSICSESHESKKNVNFGLETKKSIIHPRSDSSNRSTRFSLSSEKSYQNGLCMTPGQSGCVSTGPYMKEVVLNDDIEKRVLVNKDGSLSVEMKVRFRLCNDETLQWSTEIKKSSLKLNDSSSAKDSNYLKAKAEYSDPDSNSPSEAEEAFVTKLHQKNLEESHCQNCCNHCQEYDIWKNPMHRDQGACKSPSSGGSSHKIVHKSSVDSMRTVSRSSEEYTEHVVEKASCFQQTMEEGDTRVEYCTIRRCCSRSEVSATKSTSRRSCEESCESHGKSKCSHMHIKEPDDTISPTPHYEVTKVSEDRPVSAVSNSSKVLESLKEDQDDEYDDLPPSVSRASDWSQSDNFEGDDQSKCCCCSSQASPRSHLSPRPPSKVSSCAVHSLKLKKYKTSFTSPVEPDGLVIHTDNNRAKSTSSTSSKVSSRLHTYNCEAKTPISVASSEQHRHSHTHTPVSNAPDILQICEDEKVRDNGSLSAMSANTGLSKRSGESNECRCCGECKMEKVPQKAKEDVDSISNISFASEKSASKAQENFETVNSKTSEEDPTQERSETALSENSNTSLASKHSKKSHRTTHKRCSVGRSPETDIAEERFKSAMSVKSNASAKSSKSNQDCIISERVPTPASSLLTKGKADENIQERAASPMSGHSNISARSRTSNKSRSAPSERSRTPRSCLDNLEEVPLKLLNSQSDKSESAATQNYTTSDNLCGQDTELNQEVRSASAMSFNKSNQSSEHPSHTSEETKKSVRSCCQLIETKATQESSASEIQCEQETEITPEERLGSSLSHCSKTSLKSNESSHVKKTPSGGIVSVTEYYPEERVASAMSGKTHTSCGSCRSHKSNHNIPETTVTSAPNAENPDECATPEIVETKRTTSAMSQRSAASVKSKASSVKSIKSGPKTPETSDPMEHDKDITQNVLNVTSPLPRSKRSPSPGRLKSNHNTEIKDTNSRASSGMSGNSKISSHSKRSSKCHCHSSLNGNLKESKSRTQKEEVKDETEERVVSSLSGKSKLSAKSQMNNVQSLCNQLEEPLSPTSTASVSLGLGEEFKCDDFDEQSISGMSATTEDDRKKLELENGVEVEGRPKTATSVNSEKSKKSHHINCKTPVQAPSPVSVSHAESVMSAELNKKSNSGSQLNEDNIRVPSALSVSSSCSKSFQGSVKNTATKGNERASETVNDTNHAEKTETDNKSNISGTSSKLNQNERASGKVTPASDCLNSTKISEHSVKSKKDQSTTDRDKRSKCSSRCLEINEMKCDRDNERGSVKSLKSSKSDMRSVIKEASRPNSEVMSDISQNCKHLTKEMAKNSNKASAFHSESSRDSVLSRALSAADLLREIIGNARPVSRGSKSNASGHKVSEKEKVTDNENKKSSRRKDRKISNSSENYNDELCSELMPSCLPNASPTEVVNDWLRNIPIDGPVYEMDIELNEELNKHFTQTQGDEDTSQMDKSEAPENIIEAKPSQVEEPKESGGEEHVHEENNCSCDETKAFDERVPNETSEMDPKPQTLTQKEGLPKRCHSSVQVMKVLLGPKLDRCSSLPEVSPIYGRKLSQSAQGLLDCLAKLRLIDSDSKNEKDTKYNEIMMILKSLWLHEPSEDEQNTQNMKEHHSGEDEFNPRSSSGVDLSSGSAGSVKGSVSGLAEKSETTQGKTAPVVEHELSLQDQDEAVVAEDEQKSTAASCEDLNPSKVPSDPITLDIAEEVHDSPENKEPDVNQEKTTLPPATEEYIQSAENNNESVQTPPTSSNKSSGNESSTIKSLENTSSGTPPSVQRAPLTKRISQDPDPIWVLSLLKKIEKQFMLHYADAMAEFKVRWDLDDNEMLNAMITELKEEIHKRIQSSITRELQKIQSRAGRGPRPPGNALSRDSTVQTEQRRKRLRVMRNKSISLSRSEDNYTASGTEFSDQRSEDEYCPCDACMKKKMASKGVQRAQALSLAPVMMEFDLRKILQKKKDPAIPTELKTEEQNKSPTGNNENNLEVVHEEADEVNGEHVNEDEDQDVEKEEDGIAKTETEAINMDIVQEVSAVSEIKDSDEEKTNGKQQSEEDEEKAVTAEEEEETEEGEDGDGEVEKKEEIVVDGTADTEEKKEVEIDGEAVQGEEEEEAEKEATEGDTEEDSEEVQDGEKGERAGDEKKENMEAAEKHEITETEEETESRKEETVPEVEAAETEKREDINDERLEDNKPAEDGCESEFNKEDISVTAEGETPDESETPNEGQKESAKEMNADENQGEPAEDEAEEDKTSDAETDGEQPKENVQSQNDKEDPENPETETTGGIGGVDSEHSLAKQETRTSVESQPGSSENSNDHTGQAKLKDLHSFMESAESQGENLVVITKQPPYKESSGSHRLANTKDIVNDVIKWELTPKRHNRSQMRTNK